MNCFLNEQFCPYLIVFLVKLSLYLNIIIYDKHQHRHVLHFHDSLQCLRKDLKHWTLLTWLIGNTWTFFSNSIHWHLLRSQYFIEYCSDTFTLNLLELQTYVWYSWEACKRILLLQSVTNNADILFRLCTPSDHIHLCWCVKGICIKLEIVRINNQVHILQRTSLLHKSKCYRYYNFRTAVKMQYFM